jgi:TonB family protein
MSSRDAASSNVTLDRIGVQSPGRLWASVLGGAVLLVGLGALGAWLLMEGDASDASAKSGQAQPDDPFVIGTPLPSGEEAPGVDFVSGRGGGGPAPSSGSETGGGAGGVEDETEDERRPAGRGPRRSAPPPTTTVGFGSGSGGGSGGGSGRQGQGSDPASTAGSGASAQAGGDGTSGGGPSGESADDEGSGTEGPGAGSGSGGAGEVPAGTDAPAERDIGMELYGARVRYAVRRYYAARAQRCFGRSTRNNPNVSGTVVVALTIGSDGNVTDADVERNTTGDADLGRCLAAQVETWQLPPPPSGSLRMSMPFSR